MSLLASSTVIYAPALLKSEHVFQSNRNEMKIQIEIIAIDVPQQGDTHIDFYSIYTHKHATRFEWMENNCI